MSSCPNIPSDAIAWLRQVFHEANRRTTELIVNVPNIRETSLDDCLVQALLPFSGIKLLSSGAVVRMDVHNIGGLRRVYSWETADIALLVFVQVENRIMAQKIGMLQSKRLYPENNDVAEDDPVGFEYGMNAFFDPQPEPLAAIHRQFIFNKECKYGALEARAPQQRHIDRFNQEFGESIFYLFYNPD